MPVRRRPRRLVRESVLTRLRRYIAGRGMAPGDRLPTEQELAERFGVSRPSVREAIMALRQLGILHSAPRRGLTIGELDPQRLGECLQLQGSIRSYQPTDLVRARAIIELGILPFVAAAMAKDARLFPRLMAMTEDPALPEDPAAYLAADIALHRALLAAAGPGPIGLFAELIVAFFERFGGYASGPDRAGRENGIRQHRALLQALARQDVGEAQRLVLEGFRHYESLPPPPVPPPDAAAR